MDEEKKLTISIKAEEHRELKSLAAQKGISIKKKILQALDNTFPGWRKNNKENNQM